jgi:RNA recognition motif-containing protein
MFPAANAAIKALNDTDLDGRTLRVDVAQQREDSNRALHSKFPDSGGGNF